MKYEDCRANLKIARNVHTQNMQKALLLAKGIPKEGAPVAVNHKECDFGKWLYGNEANLKAAAGYAVYDEIETLHREWHEEYAKIYKLYYEDTKQGVFSKMLGVGRKMSELDQEKAKAYLDDMKKITWSLTKKLESLEKRF